ncbi:MAG: hypothetical protein ACYDGL_00805 [Bellilinea sp.]
MSQQTALGISVGDVIKTGYESGPYLVEKITDPQVDYSDRSRVFHCTKCGHDFNGLMWNGGFTCPYCPFCLANGRQNVSVKIFFMPAVIPGQNYPSAYQVSMGYIEPWKELLEVTHGR